MPARTAEIALTFLRRTYDHKWEFGITPDERFDRLIEVMAYSLRYALRTIYYTPGSGHFKHGKGYEISDEGLWVVSHLFSNYSEMRETIPEPEWRIFEEPRKQCSTCHTPLSNYWTCTICYERLCPICTPEHTHTYKRTEEKRQERHEQTKQQIEFCEACKQPAFERQPCLHCGQRVCMNCYTLHKQQSNPFQGFTFGYSFDGTLDMDYAKFWEHLFESQSQQQKYSSGGYATQAPRVSNEVRDAFKTLGLVDMRATAAEIKRAYRKLAAQYHPDRPTGNVEKMKQVNRARDVALGHAGGK
jgi:DnaJ domain